MLEKAFLNKYAIGAFNINNLETVQAVVKAARKNNSHVILQVSPSAIDYADIEYLISIIKTAVEKTKLDIALHLDHGFKFETIELAIKSGFSSIMFDGSSLDYRENIRLTKEVCYMSHKKNITVEAELGRLQGIEDEVKVDAKEASYTDPIQAVEFVKETEVDSLAVAIGTSHGAYKFKGNAKLDFDRLNLISESLNKNGLKNFPIVLHGASSVEKKYVDMCNDFGGKLINAAGVPADVLRQASKLSVCKINLDTDLRLAMTAIVRKELSEEPSNIDPRNYLSKARDTIEEIVDFKIKNILCSINSCENL
jgi:fructose-bisphosphate aldolase class II